MRIAFVIGFCLGFLLATLYGLGLQILASFRPAKPLLLAITTPSDSAKLVTVKQSRILCWVPFRYQVKNKTFTDPLLNVSFAEQVNRMHLTYGSLCDKFYIVTEHGNELPSHQKLFLAHHYARESNRDLWNQVSHAWFRIGQLHLQDYEWFIKLDSDSFLVPGNLRHLLLPYDADSLQYFGHTIFEQSRPLNELRTQFNAGAGYGISRGLLREILPYIVRNVSVNPSSVPVQERCNDLVRWGEDVKFADCLRVVLPRLAPMPTKDLFNRERFHLFEPSYHMMILHPAGGTTWFWRGKDLNQTTWLFRALSTRPVLFHHFKLTRQFYFCDYLLHRVMVDPAAAAVLV